MSDNAVFAVIFATSVASCTACTVSDRLIAAKVTTPQQMCMEKAWTQADRIQCLQAQP